MNIKLYDPITRFDQGGTAYGEMEENSDGDYARFEDYESLLKMADRMREFMASLKYDESHVPVQWPMEEYRDLLLDKYDKLTNLNTP